jgi:hypothetical protein
MQTPTGPRCPFMSKDNDELVPGFEISKTICLLEISPEEFLAMLEGCQTVKDSDQISKIDPELES